MPTLHCDMEGDKMPKKKRRFWSKYMSLLKISISLLDSTFLSQLFQMLFGLIYLFYLYACFSLSQHFFCSSSIVLFLLRCSQAPSNPIGVNLTNILRAHFSYESQLSSFFLVTFWPLAKGFWQKCKMLMTLTIGRSIDRSNEQLWSPIHLCLVSTALRSINSSSDLNDQ